VSSSCLNTPMCVTLTLNCRRDVRDIYDDFWALKFHPRDTAYKHIFEACTPGKICPNHGYIHQWRVIDLGLGQFFKTGSRLYRKEIQHTLGRIFTRLADGEKC
jgi:hypothetical protein